MRQSIMWKDMSRRAFVKGSAGMMAAFAGLPQLLRAQVMSHDVIKPFTIAVPEAVLKDLHERLDRTRFPDQLDNTGWLYGTEQAYLREL